MMKIFTQIALLLSIFMGQPAFCAMFIERGTFDVSVLPQRQTLDLEGEWLAFPDRLLSAQEVMNIDWNTAQYERVGYQNLFDIRRDDPLSKTYVLKLKGLQKQQSWALHSAMILNSTRAYII